MALLAAGARAERIPEPMVHAATGLLDPAQVRHLHNLPAELSSFVGREQELDCLGKMLPTTRLLTLTGTGGMGKTRSALRLAASLVGSYGDGIWLVEFAPLVDPDLVPQAVATALGIREQPGRPLLEVLLDAVRPRRLLLVLDNCEHVLDASATLAMAVLQVSPDLRVLATSRESLGIAGEQLWPVAPLRLPGPSDTEPTTSEAVQLFVARARLAWPDFPVDQHTVSTVAEVCRRLDGIPLAIELAAARVDALSTAQIIARLEDGLHLLTTTQRTAPPRQRTLSATLEWSYQLLSAVEQHALDRVAVFAGGWTLDAAEVVIIGEDIAPEAVLIEIRPP